MAIILIGGGARSGKSRYALDLAQQTWPAKLMFLATAQPSMRRWKRGSRSIAPNADPDFTTIEEPIEIADAIRKADADAIVVDCLTLWLSNIMLAFGRDVDADIENLVRAAQESPAAIFLVTNEVGCGIVPESTLGRDFRDRSGHPESARRRGRG